MSCKREGYEVVLIESFRSCVPGQYLPREYAFRGGEIMERSSDSITIYAPKKVAWTGPGLPPGGTVCEAFNEAYEEWRKVKILDHQGGISAAVCRDDSDRLWWSNKFRPIRTPEQIAAEDRENAIKAMREFGVDAGDSTIELTCAALYDAGYRKFEIIDEPKS